MKSEIENARRENFNNVYKELIELVGLENTIKLHEFYGEQYITFPKRILKESYLHQRIVEEYDGRNARELARKYEYSYSWIMKVLKKHGDGDKEK